MNFPNLTSVFGERLLLFANSNIEINKNVIWPANFVKRRLDTKKVPTDAVFASIPNMMPQIPDFRMCDQLKHKQSTVSPQSNIV